MSSGRRQVVFDADVLMNLAATDHLDAVLASTGIEGLVCPVTESEALYLDARHRDGPRDQIDLGPSFRSGLLVRCVLQPIEVAAYVRLAAQVDDGEAQVLAVASHRSLSVATDDRKARRLAGELGLPLLGTPELVVPWAASLPDLGQASAAIIDIERRAHFRPRSSDESRREWDRLRDGP